MTLNRSPNAAAAITASDHIQPNTMFNERDAVRREIQQIISRRIHADAHSQLSNRSKRRVIIKQSFIFDNILYKRALCMQDYSDLNTLESRVMRWADMICTLRRDRQQEE